MPKEYIDIQLSKIDVARRQLDHALKLFFFNGDSVIVHVLAGNAQEILYSLGKKSGIKSFILDDMFTMVRPEKKKDFLYTINEPKNFFKHAATDSTKTLPFSDGRNHYLLWDACLLYNKLTNELTDIMQVFLNWFYAIYPDILTEKSDIEKYRNFFSNPKNRPTFYQEVMDVLSQKYKL